MNEQEFNDLLDRYRQGIATDKEKRMIEGWLQHNRNRADLGHLPDPEKENIRLSILNKIESKRLAAEPIPLRKVIYRVAASLLLITAVGSALYVYNTQQQGEHNVAVTHVVVPGGDKAVLLLADGTQVELNDAAGKAIPQQGVAQVVNASGKLSYHVSGAEVTSVPVAYNTVSTPRGGQYQLTLADGSSVWLNAASSLKFPAVFSGDARIVELTGEAYFEVAKHATKPFKVITANISVEVLGTHFNVMAYNEEGSAKATLIEGSVKVTALQQTQLLKPGQQANHSGNGKLTVISDRNVIDEAVAWKNGMFRFRQANVVDIMQQVSRWYDVDIRYEEDLRDLYFGLAVSRRQEASSLLRILEQTGAVHFEINGKQITVRRGAKPGNTN